MSGHICHVITNLTAAGAEQYAVQLSNYIHSQGHRVSIVAGEPHTIRNRVAPGVHVETVQMHPGESRSLLVYLRILVPAVWKLVAYFRRENVTVVHTHLMASALPAWVAAKICGIPVMHSKMHSLGIVSGYQRAIFASKLHLALVSRFLVFTKHSVEEVRDVWGVPEDRLLVSSIGVDIERYQTSSELRRLAREELGLGKADVVLLAVARLHPDKDVGLAILAARQLDDPNVVLLIAGDGEQRAQLEDLARNTAGRTRIRFLGLVQDLRPVYASGDLLLQTTRGPDLGTVVLEAIASAVPIVIAFRDADERRMAENTLDGRNIGAIAPADPRSLAGAIADLTRDREKLRTLGLNARGHAKEHHDRDAAYGEIMRTYDEMART